MTVSKYVLREMRNNPKMYARLSLMDTEELREIHRRAWRTVAILSAPRRGHVRAAGHTRHPQFDGWTNERVAWRLMDAASAALDIGLKQIGAAQQSQWQGAPEYFDLTYRASFDFPNQPLEVAS